MDIRLFVNRMLIQKKSLDKRIGGVVIYASSPADRAPGRGPEGGGARTLKTIQRDQRRKRGERWSEDAEA